MIALSVDLGHARTGLAVSDKSGFLASSLCVITEHNDEKLIQKIAEKVKETKAQIIVVGLPRNMDGSEGESALRARELAARLSELTGVPHHMQDERGTTITAHSYLSAGNVYGKKRKQKVDAVAASIILQDYLDSQK
ncbi:Holliday junction resolvase RuvX [Ruminococcus difficilis]|uniref:Putative pre-16S rRNA nuclease n=1 Tax=Ruminococcus difficilis TaxID=2763069 RepID=A0A934U320_9FIRM|nr:Holliday junction resolvase RuvX [Ruminococcus difficilis]MBK6087459.1 Holliday junction resolvase RuvX [Ruminococcus difficilis]